MKLKLIVVFLSYFPLMVFAQSINGKVIDAQTKEPLPYANIVLSSKNKGVSTDENGMYTFDVAGDIEDALMISYLGYTTQEISLKQFSGTVNNILNIELTENTSVIDEVVLEVKKAKYSSTKTIGVKKKKKKRFRIGTQYGSEKCTYVGNERHRKGKVLELNFYLKENLGSQFKTLPTYYRVKFYSYDVEKQQPGKLLSYKDIFVEPENNTQKIILDLTTHNVLFPEKGICVGIETIKPSKIILPKSSMYTTAPSLVWVHGETSNTWSSFMGKKWSKNNRKSVHKKKYYTNPLIQLKVQYRK